MSEDTAVTGTTPRAPLMKTVEQQRAAYAWECVRPLTGKALGDYRDLVRKLPAMILSTGLGQTLAFMGSKKSAAHQSLGIHLAKWLGQPHPMPVPGLPIYHAADNTALNLLVQVGKGSSAELRRATVEALALAGWLKRFAEAKENLSDPGHESRAPRQGAPEAGERPPAAGTSTNSTDDAQTKDRGAAPAGESGGQHDHA